MRDGAGVGDEDYHVEDCGDPFTGFAGFDGAEGFAEAELAEDWRGLDG